MREYITSYDDIPGFAGHIWSALHQEMREKPDVALLVEVTPDRRRTMHYGGTYFGSETSISMSGVKHFPAIDAKPFRGHSGTWLAVYAWLRERFVNGGLDKP